MKTRTPEYERYHAQVVEACVKLMGEEHREFFNVQRDYFDEYDAMLTPEEVAKQQFEALT